MWYIVVRVPIVWQRVKTGTVDGIEWEAASGWGCAYQTPGCDVGRVKMAADPGWPRV